MKGRSLKPWPYVLKDDEDAPKEEQTIFWIKPLPAFDQTDIEVKLGSTEGIGRDGMTRYDAKGRKRALKEILFQRIGDIENFHFNEDRTPELAEKGWLDIEDDDKYLKTECLDQLEPTHLTELLNAAFGERTNHVDKKKSNSSPRSDSGQTITRKTQKATSA